jgi:hypothetical protein
MEDQIIYNLKKPIAQPIGTAAAELKRACAATRRHGRSQEIFARWPNLRDASQRLASLLTLYWPDPRTEGGSLLVNCLEAAFAASERAFIIENNDMDEQVAFIRMVSSEMVHCLSVSVMVRKYSHWTMYEPLVCGNLDEVIRSQSSEELAWVRRHDVDAATEQNKLVCASRVFSPSELKLAGLMV